MITKKCSSTVVSPTSAPVAQRFGDITQEGVYRQVAPSGTDSRYIVLRRDAGHYVRLNYTPLTGLLEPALNSLDLRMVPAEGEEVFMEIRKVK